MIHHTSAGSGGGEKGERGQGQEMDLLGAKDLRSHLGATSDSLQEGRHWPSLVLGYFQSGPFGHPPP